MWGWGAERWHSLALPVGGSGDLYFGVLGHCHLNPFKKVWSPACYQLRNGEQLTVSHDTLTQPDLSSVSGSGPMRKVLSCGGYTPSVPHRAMTAHHSFLRPGFAPRVEVPRQSCSLAGRV